MLTLRHPVLTSDGHLYEARELLRWFESSDSLVSPLNRQQITEIAYIDTLHGILNRYAPEEERYENYQYEPEMQKLVRYIESGSVRQASLLKDIQSDLVISGGLFSSSFLAMTMGGCAISSFTGRQDVQLPMHTYMSIAMVYGGLDLYLRHCHGGRGLMERIFDVANSFGEAYESLLEAGDETFIAPYLSI